MTKILITGCSGFLAAYLVDVLTKDRNNELFGLTEETDFKTDKYDFFHIDIRNRDDIFSIVNKIRPDILFHLAAISNVGFSWKNQKLTYEVNFIGSSNILEAVDAFARDSRVILMSSAEIYGDYGESINEGCKVSIKNPYSLSKYAMELLGDLFCSVKDLNVIKVRSFNFTGAGQNPRFVASDFAYQIALIEKGEREPIIKVGNLSAVRDFSDVRDIARYLTVIGQKGEKGAIYNLSSGNLFSIKEILENLLSHSKRKIEIMIDESKFRPVDIPVLSADCSLIQERFNLFPRYSIEQTLKDLLTYWRKKVM
jgi:GDP-4-dehydro-6-deoxy-D-mannose reductase